MSEKFFLHAYELKIMNLNMVVDSAYYDRMLIQDIKKSRVKRFS